MRLPIQHAEDRENENLSALQRIKAMNRGDDEDEDEDEDILMNTSETKKCYVYGQCQVCILNHNIIGAVWACS